MLYNQRRKISFSVGSEYENYGLLGCDSFEAKYGGCRFLETLMSFYQTALHHIPGDHYFQLGEKLTRSKMLRMQVKLLGHTRGMHRY
jgi:hypothetical protein